MRTNPRRLVRRRTVLAGFRTTLIVGTQPMTTHGVDAQTVIAFATSPTRLGDLYAQVGRDNPRITAAEALVRAAQARVPGAKRPPDPQLQLGFMNYSLPGLRPMAPL